MTEKAFEADISICLGALPCGERRNHFVKAEVIPYQNEIGYRMLREDILPVRIVVGESEV